jgi:hypothetical protein
MIRIANSEAAIDRADTARASRNKILELLPLEVQLELPLLITLSLKPV